RFFVFTLRTGIAHSDRETLPAFHRLRHHPAAQGYLNRVLNVGYADSIASGFLAVDVDLQIAFAHDRRGDDIAGAVDRLESCLDVLADTVDDGQVRAKHLDADIGANPGREHIDAVDNRLGKNIAPPGHLEHAIHLIVHQVSLRSGLPGPEE